MAAHAGAADTSSSEQITDPAYLPGKHTFLGTTALGYGKFSGSVTGAAAYSFNTNGRDASQSLSYGISDTLTVWGTLDHGWSDTRYNFGSGASQWRNTNSSPLSVGLTQRLLDQGQHSFNLDLSAGLGSPGQISAAISRESGSFSVLARAGVYRLRSFSGFDLAKNTDVNVDQRWGYFAGVQTQYRPSRRLSFDLNAGYSSANFSSASASAVVSGQPTSFQIKYPDFLGIGVAASFHIVSDRLVARLGGSYQFIGERHDTYADRTLDTVVGRRNARAIGFALLYAF